MDFKRDKNFFFISNSKKVEKLKNALIIYYTLLGTGRVFHNVWFFCNDQ